MKQLFTYLIQGIFFGLLFVSCGQEKAPCPDEPVPDLRTKLEASSNPETLKIQTLGLDDVKTYTSDYPDFIYTPLNLEDTTTGFVLSFEESTDAGTVSISDTVWVSYSTKYTLNDLECGFETEFTITQLSYTAYVIDTITFLDLIIDSNKNYNVQISY